MIATTTHRVPEQTASRSNEKIRQETERNIVYFSQQSREVIDRRLKELDEEWDVERAIEANAAAVLLASFVFGTLASRKWYLLSAVVGGFLLQHAIQGSCPPVLRRFGFRTQHEIEKERCALMAAREKEHATEQR